MVSETVDDERRWAEAQSILARMPTESAEQKRRRWVRLRVLMVIGVAVLGAAVAAVLVLLLPDSALDSGESSTARVVTGIVISSFGLLIALGGLVLQFRGLRRIGGVTGNWSAVLTRAQRKQLMAQVRGRRPPDQERLPLACSLAERLLTQRLVLIVNIGLLLNFIGQWVMSPSGARAALALIFAAALAVAAVFIGRDTRRAQRFLDEHRAAIG